MSDKNLGKRNNINSYIRFCSILLASFLYLGIVILIVYSPKFLYNFLLNSKYFRLEEIEIIGLNKIAPSEIFNITKLERGKSILAFNSYDISSKIKMINKIEWVKVIRELPNKILIQLEEKKPKAVISLFNNNIEQLFYVSRNGEVFQELEPCKDIITLPIIRINNNKPEFMKSDILKSLNLIEGVVNKRFANFSDIKEVVQDKHGMFILITSKNLLQDTPMRINFGNKNFIEKLERLEKIVNFIKEQKKEISILDLRFDKRIIIIPVENKTAINLSKKS